MKKEKHNVKIKFCSTAIQRAGCCIFYEEVVIIK